MDTLQGEIQNTMSQLVRKAAGEYGQAVTQYGNAFAAYGRGDVDAIHVAETTANLLSGKARNFLELGMGLATTYAKWSLSLWGIKVLRTEEPKSTTILEKKVQRRKKH